MSNQLGPITKNTTYVPDFTINTYLLTYNTNGATCEYKPNNVGIFESGDKRTKFVYKYSYNTQFPNNDNMDVTCTSTGKTFGGWATSKGSTDPAEFKITGSGVELFPIFTSKISVKIQLGNQIVYNTLVDKNTTITKEQLLSSAISTINAGHYSDSYNISSMSDSISLYTSNDYKTLFERAKVDKTTIVYIKPDPYITFNLNNSKAKFADNTTAPKKIALSELSSGKKIPSATISDQHRHLQNWKLQTTTTHLNYPDKLSPDSTQLKDADPTKLFAPVTYVANFVLNTYKVTFKDKDNSCGKGVSTVIEVDANTIIDRNNTTFAGFNCSQVGYTFKGWQKENFTTNSQSYSYCPAINLILAIIIIVIIAYIVKYIVNGFSNSRSRSVVLRNNKQL